MDKSQNDLVETVSLELEIKGGTASKFNDCFVILIFKILKCP